ncbi:MAG: hypothetical protein IKZ30_00360 [Oscillospiraceae bacterium]|nr:hypothetical protein [Oscillospiraceae bacterium]
MMYSHEDGRKIAAEACRVELCEPKREATMTELVNNAVSKAASAYNLALLISRHMIYEPGNGDVAGANEPRCFRDVLVQHNACLSDLVTELERLAKEIGIGNI